DDLGGVARFDLPDQMDVTPIGQIVTVFAQLVGECGLGDDVQPHQVHTDTEAGQHSDQPDSGGPRHEIIGHESTPSSSIDALSSAMATSRRSSKWTCSIRGRISSKTSCPTAA